MILKARDPKSFLAALVGEVNSARKAKGFEEKVKAIKRLSLVDVESFEGLGGSAEPTFRGRRFSVQPERVGTHTVSMVTGTEDYAVIRAHGVERLLRSFFSDKQVRRLAEQIAAGDEVLRGAVLTASHESRGWDCGDGRPCDVSLFPVRAIRGGVEVGGCLPQPYLNRPQELVMLCSAASGEPNPIPLGNFEVRVHGDLGTRPLLVEQPVPPYRITARLDTFSVYPDETISEKMYNAQHGVSYRISRETMEAIDRQIISSEGNPRLLGRILFLVAGLLGVSGGDTRPVMALLERVLQYMQDVTIDELVSKGEFSGGRAMSAAVFSEIVSRLSDATLFRLTREGGALLRVVDAHGIEVGNIPQHVYREQMRRYRGSGEMDMTVRSLLATMGTMEDKQRLLSLVFESGRIGKEQ